MLLSGRGSARGLIPSRERQRAVGRRKRLPTIRKPLRTLRGQDASVCQPGGWQALLLVGSTPQVGQKPVQVVGRPFHNGKCEQLREPHTSALSPEPRQSSQSDRARLDDQQALIGGFDGALPTVVAAHARNHVDARGQTGVQQETGELSASSRVAHVLRRTFCRSSQKKTKEQIPVSQCYYFMFSQGPHGNLEKAGPF